MASIRNTIPMEDEETIAQPEDLALTLDRIGHGKEMRICIPTYKRFGKGKQKTFGIFSAAKIPCTLVVRAEEEREYKTNYPLADLLTIPNDKKVDDIGKTRQFILDWAYANSIKYICMADDDLSFNLRGKNNKQSDKVDTTDTVRLFQQQLQWLDTGIVHCGIATASIYQEKKWLKPEVTFMENTKLFCFISLNVGKVFEAGVSYRLPLVEDYDFTLQLLTKKYKNRVSVEFSLNPGSGKEGGCFTYRTSENHTKALEELARLHNVDGKNIVRLKEKKSKSRPDEKTGAYITWKSAYNGKLNGKRPAPESKDAKQPNKKQKKTASHAVPQPAEYEGAHSRLFPANPNPKETGAGAGSNPAFGLKYH